MAIAVDATEGPKEEAPPPLPSDTKANIQALSTKEAATSSHAPGQDAGIAPATNKVKAEQEYTETRCRSEQAVPLCRFQANVWNCSRARAEEG
jgi:hypothetical protein